MSARAALESFIASLDPEQRIITRIVNNPQNRSAFWNRSYRTGNYIGFFYAYLRNKLIYARWVINKRRNVNLKRKRISVAGYG